MIRRLTRTLRLADGSMRAYVARPDASDALAVVLLHGEAGLDDAARAACDALARLGCLALCPDLFWRGAAAPFDPVTARDDVAQVVEAIRRETLGAEPVVVVGLGPAGLAAALAETGGVPMLQLAPLAPAAGLASAAADPVSAPVRRWLAAQLGAHIVSPI